MEDLDGLERSEVDKCDNRAGYKLPPLTTGLVQEIIFGMENQDQEMCFDVQSGMVVPEEEVDNQDYALELPDWTSRDGFGLMQRFSENCGNKKVKAALLKELGSHQRGVFRRFRAVLDENPEELQKWYSFKEKKMASEVRIWYRDLNKPVSEFEKVHDMDSLVLQDFQIELDFGDYSDEIKELSPREFQDKETEAVISLDPMDELVGFVSYIIEKEDSPKARVLHYFVKEEYRKLGLFDLMYEKFLSQLREEKVSSVLFPVSADFDFIANRFAGMNSRVVKTVLDVSLE